MSTSMTAAQAAQQNNRGPGGQYSFGTHAEPTGVELSTSGTQETDLKAKEYLGDLVRKYASFEIGRWQRRTDTPTLSTTPPEPQWLTRLREQSRDFEDLERDEQAEVLTGLNIADRGFLLQEGQRLGNTAVRVPDGIELTAEQTGLVLTGQHCLAKLDIHEPAAFDRFTKQGAVFVLDHDGLAQEITVGADRLHVETRAKDDDPRRKTWLDRAARRNLSSPTAYTPEQLQHEVTRQHEAGILMECAYESPVVGQHPELFDKFSESGRTLLISGTSHGAAFRLDVAGKEPALIQPGGSTYHPIMTKAYIGHMAELASHHGGGDGLVKELREVFREAERRQVP